MRLVSETSIAFRKWSSQVRGFAFTTSKQDCILVGCVPPAYWPYPVVLGEGVLPNALWMQTPWCRPRWSCDLCCMLRSQPPCEQNDWQTGVKTLPCPKLRLRAVKSETTDLAFDYTLNVVKFLTPRSREMNASFDWEHSPGAMILGPIEYMEYPQKFQNICVTCLTLFVQGFVSLDEHGRLLCIKHDFSLVFE